MRVPVSWLKQYVPIDISAKELAHLLTMAGNEVGEVEEIGGDWDRDKIVVGHVLKVDPHPNADRLTLPTVDLGNGETITVVCGAPNVAEGQKIAFAREGAHIFSPRSGKVEELKAATIRGVRSEGMVCSPLELGMSEDHEGILELDEDAPVGTPLVDYLGDAVLDIEVTPNRPDCLSVLGVAHEVAALTGKTLTEPDLSYPEEGGPIGEQAKVEIANPELCNRYTATLMTGIEIGSAPQWIQDALIKAGQRPINNIVDITNFVMLEYGQPLHAFDFDKVKDRTIIVRAAHEGEEHVTLDGEKRLLSPPMLMIADPEKSVGLAGVMGGSNTELDEGTRTVLLESANFDAGNTRRTRSGLRLNTEASYRFERGIRAELAPLALRRATQLMVEHAGAKAYKGIIDVYPGEKDPPVVKISRQRIRQVLGVDYSMSKVEEVLKSLGFERAGAPEGLIDMMETLEAGAIPERDDALWMKAPYWRSDISIEDDLVEEVARIVGYDSIPTMMLSTPIPHHEPQASRVLREHVKDILVSAGMRETISYSLTTMDTLARVGALDDGLQPMKIANPMSADFEYLRTSLRGSILQTLSFNRRISQGEGMKLFEIGNVYLPRDEAKERELPNEREMLVGLFQGPRNPDSWLVPQEDMGFFDAKGVLEYSFANLKVDVAFEPLDDDSILQAGRAARLISGGQVLGVVGEVRPEVLARFGLDGAPVALLEVNMEALGIVVPEGALRYSSSSPYPESYRDLALIIDAGLSSSRVQTIIERHGMVARSAPFDVYEGDGVPAGKKSVAYRIVFQSDKGTLTSEQVDQFQGDILRRLQRELGAELRQ